MKYLLDTDTCIYALKQRQPVLDILLSKRRVDVALSAITEAELRTGAAKSSAPMRTLEKLHNFLAPIQILAFDSVDAMAYAKLRSQLEKKGQPIGPMDMLIAAQALVRSLILVTNNQREFKRVGRLQLANWAA